MKAFDVLHARRQLLLVSVAYLFTPLSALSAPRGQRDATHRLLDKLRQLHPGTEFTAVRATPIAGWFEVWMDRNVAYVNESHPRYFVFGRLFDTQKAVDLTSAAEPARAVQAVSTSSAIDWSSLPLSDAFALQRGPNAERRVMAVFSDPGCGHCRVLEEALDQVANVTVHVFLLPFQGEALPQAVWCNASRSQAWQQWMRDGIRPPAADTPCDTPLARNLALAQRLGIRGTPTMLFTDGSRIEGTVAHQVIEERLRQATGAGAPPGSRS
jgi:thiol:disulfide interchange protein DsbC